MKNFVLESGRRVSVAQLHQEPTYSGMLAGKPCSYVNESIIEDIAEQAHSLYSGLTQPFLVVPSPESVAGRLPAIACVAVLESDQLKGGSKPYSALTVMWFQDELAPPFPSEVEILVRTLDWERLAAEFSP